MSDETPPKQYVIICFDDAKRYLNMAQHRQLAAITETINRGRIKEGLGVLRGSVMVNRTQ